MAWVTMFANCSAQLIVVSPKLNETIDSAEINDFGSSGGPAVRAGGICPFDPEVRKRESGKMMRTSKIRTPGG
jgi:hypothetical protein